MRVVDFAKDTRNAQFIIFANDALKRLTELETDLGKKDQYFRHLIKMVINCDHRSLPELGKDAAGTTSFIRKRSEDLLTDNILLYSDFLLQQKLYQEVLFLVQEGLVIAKRNDRRLPRVSSLYDLAGWACWNLGKVDEAIDWARKAKVHSNRFFNLKEDQFLYHLGLYLQKAGIDAAEAKESLEHALKITRNDTLKQDIVSKLKELDPAYA